ncbi:hypothetical protein [Phytohabitans suffuscus]|uniref:Uncharacterized protein n=1 Tax=Phytohabitans suffuscus TaxID=624315 RepID=A0A6F8YTG5_9ACTN|nr:hypothetical protein [Phytohabitans suffuscus]BCB89404.1 hypothetical protein Psuf_067170 [Phytohabitans suffuscus]
MCEPAQGRYAREDETDLPCRGLTARCDAGAEALDASLDVISVRKPGVPDHPELAMRVTALAVQIA